MVAREKPSFDYQGAFAMGVLLQKSETMQAALDMPTAECAYCGVEFQKGSMMRRDKKLFCNGWHGALYYRLRKADTLAMQGKDDEALGVLQLDEALAETQRLEGFPNLLRLIDSTAVADTGETATEKGVVHQNERVYGENQCLFCGAEIATHGGRGRRAQFCKAVHRVAYNRLKHAMATGTVEQLIAPLADEADAEPVAQPGPVAEVVEKPKREYVKVSKHWERREFGVLDWSAKAFAPITLIPVGDKFRWRCKCGALWGSVITGDFDQAVWSAEFHTTMSRKHIDYMALRARGEMMRTTRKTYNAGNVVEWNGFIIGQTVPESWVTN